MNPIGSDHDLLQQIHTLLTEHVKRFEDHVRLDDRREVEYRIEVKETSLKVAEIAIRQTQVLWVFGIALTLLQIALRWWK